MLDRYNAGRLVAVTCWLALVSLAAAVASALAAAQNATGPTPAPTDIRKPHDTVGFTHSAEGIARVVKAMIEVEQTELDAVRRRLGYNEQTQLVGAISPHDDYQYAGPVYLHVFPYVRARHVILIGVAHRARNFPESEGRLVFDSFPAWHGPYAPVKISPLRQDLLDALAPGDRLVVNAMHAGEHSLEALVPFLQHYHREAAIVPILVPYMSWERLVELADRTTRALEASMKKRGLTLGRDVAVLVSSDSVHYGDRGWGGRSFAELGTNGAGYDKAVARDQGLIRDHLSGVLSCARIEGFYRKVVAEDYHDYRITWCGRFSIPFGLALLHGLGRALESGPVRGDALRYATTLDPGRTDPGVEGLGITAGASLRHWVGFCAVGYRLASGGAPGPHRD